MRKYIVELVAPPFPAKNGHQVFAYRKHDTWSVDYLSPDMIDYWEVNATSRENAIAEAMILLHRAKMHLLYKNERKVW